MTRESKGARGNRSGKKRSASEIHAEHDVLLKDSRFSEATWDPRFSRVPKLAKGGIDDERFKAKLKKDPSFREKFTPVDRFGRPKKAPVLPNSLRILATSDDECGSEDSAADESLERDAVFLHAKPIVEDDDEESDLDDFVEDAEELESIPRGKATKRLAVIGLDWSVTRAVDILASLGSFCPRGKRILYAEVHPSKFGLSRLAVEAKFGPQVIGDEDLKVVKEAKIMASISAEENNTDDLDEDYRTHDLVTQEQENEETSKSHVEDSENSASSEDDTDSIDNNQAEKVRDDQTALRRYEEERLNYYYGVVEFEDEKSANAVYEQCDGVEYAQSGRAFDLRFIPTDMKIVTTPRDRAENIPEGYNPPNADSSSLNNSTVKLSWDADDPERMVLKTRAFTKHELDEDDLRAYLASSSDDESGENLSRNEIEKKRTILLGVTENPEDKSGDEDVDLEVSFEPGMLEKGEEILSRKREKDEHQGETPWETRLRRIREQKNEKRRRRRELLASKGTELESTPSSDDDKATSAAENPIFSDPFFSSENRFDDNKAKGVTKLKSNPKENFKSRKVTNGEGSEEEGNEHQRLEQANLELLTMTVEGGSTGGDKFREALAAADSDDEERQERKINKRTRGKRRWQKQKEVTATKPSVMDTDDARFQGLFNSHLFAIDPTHPKFRDNDTTRNIMLEKSRRVRKQPIDSPTPNRKQTNSDLSREDVIRPAVNANSELRQLAARVKARAKAKTKRSNKV